MPKPGKWNSNSVTEKVRFLDLSSPVLRRERERFRAFLRVSTWWTASFNRNRCATWIVETNQDWGVWLPKKIHHAVTRLETLLHALKSRSTCYLPCYSTSCNLEGIWSDKKMCLWSWSNQSKSSANLPQKEVANTSSLAFCFCFQGESVPKTSHYHHPSVLKGARLVG